MITEESNRNRWVRAHPDFVILTSAYAQRILIQLEIRNFDAARRIIDEAERKLAEIVEHKPLRQEEFLEMNLSNDLLKLPLRVINPLRTMQIETVHDLLMTNAATLRSIRNFGDWAIRRVLEGLLEVATDKHLRAKINDRMKDFNPKSKAKKVKQCDC
jgi:DNA-directed RNA polymerase alpha subunit